MRRVSPVPAAVNLHTIPQHLEQSTRWSDDPVAQDAHQVLSALKGMPELLAMLTAAAKRAAAEKRGQLPRNLRPRAHGPQRMPGNWVLAYLGFVMSGECDIQPWHKRIRHDRHFWRLCNFTRVPRYQTVYQCFCELEGMSATFNAAASQLMRRLHKTDPRVGAWWHIDASEAETNATPRHDCHPGDPCPTRRSGRVVRASTLVAAELRRAATDQAVTREEQGEAEQEVAVAWQGTSLSAIQSAEIDHQRGGVRIRSGAHYWFSRDLTAGSRAYYTQRRLTKFWHGFLTQTVVDHFTSLPLAINIFPAHRQEAAEYETAFTRAAKNLGGDTPKLVAGDRGYAFGNVFEFNTSKGVGSVIQYRRQSRHSPLQAPAGTTFDVHGVPACQHCRGLTDFVRFRIDGPQGNRPRLWVRCAVPQTPACMKEQAISCSRDWRRLLPVWRTHPAYHAMRTSHQVYERKHQALRSNYLVAPNAFAIRPKRIGIKCQQLRANAALLIEWLRFILQGGLRVLDVVETSGRAMRYSIGRRRARLGLIGGGIDTPRPSRRGPNYKPPRPRPPGLAPAA